MVWWLLGLAGGLGLLGSVLLEVAWGLNIALWMSLLIVCFGVFSRRFKMPNQVWWCWGFVLIFAWLFVLRDSSFLRFWNAIALFLALGLASAWTRFGMIQQGFLGVLQVWLNALLQILFGWLSLLAREIPWHDLLTKQHPKRFVAFIRGLLILLPLLLIFGAMLSSADAVFAKLLSQVFTWNMNSSIFAWAFRFVFITALVLGLLRLSALGQSSFAPLKPVRLGQVELTMVLGGLNALFMVFILIQFGYFFGGQAQITTLTGLTYADYARRGFNELVQVVALAFPVLIVCLHLSNYDQKSNQAVRILSSITLVLLAIMLYSAWQRLGLYREAYGLTEIRFYTAVFLVWLAAMLVYYAITALQQHYSRFVLGVIISIFLALMTLNIINPVAIIVETNLARATKSEAFDLEYALTLGTDALVPLLKYKQFGSFEKQQLEAAHKKMMLGSSAWDWRSWNWSAAQAVDLYK